MTTNDIKNKLAQLLNNEMFATEVLFPLSQLLLDNSGKRAFSDRKGNQIAIDAIMVLEDVLQQNFCRYDEFLPQN
jgi:hypothetical protein